MEFAHNHAKNRSTNFSPFQVVYPWCPLDLALLPDHTRIHGKAVDFVENLQHIHKQTYECLVVSTAKYKASVDRRCRLMEFSVEDLIWAVLTKDHFPFHEYNKLKARKIGTLQVLEKINPNEYQLHLPLDVNTSHVFNVKHLVPFADDFEVVDSRKNLFQAGGIDAA